jgi:thioredoxin-like negative regulator of GroEL
MNVVEATDADFAQKLSENSKVIVKYYAGWCGTCRLFSPKFKRLSADDQYRDITFLDVNAEKNPQARKMAGVDNLPFFAIFKNGKLVEGTSTSKEEKVLEMLKNLN